MSKPFEFKTIYTLDARNNIILDIFSNYLELSNAEIFEEIKRSFRNIVTKLHIKGIRYEDLKAALVPDAKKVERAYIFDWSLGSSWYGNEIHNILLPLLPQNSTRSVLAGDWVGNHSFREILSESEMIENRDALFSSNLPNTLYIVYLNNLTVSAANRITDGLTQYRPFLGALDVTYMSPMKAFLAHMLLKLYIQHKRIIIQPQSDDTPHWENENLIGYNFAQHGYQERSVPQRLYQLLLSYKIECPTLPQFQSDTYFSLNALTPTPTSLRDLNVVLDDAKHQYLINMKQGSMKRTRLALMKPKEIGAKIFNKLNSNYIYNLSWTEQDSTLKFNIMLEEPDSDKYLVSLKYIPDQRELKVLTIF